MISLLWSVAAFAHRPGLSAARIESDALTLSLSEVEWEALQPDGPSLSIAVDGTSCELGSGVVGPSADGGVEMTMPVDCPAGEEVTYSADFIAEIGSGHRHYVEGDSGPLGVLDASAPTISFDALAGSPLEVVFEFLQLGVEHILIGYDHLAFLLCLLLVVRTAKETLGVVTAFTVAHSLTLSLAALGLVLPPIRTVEILIAASIAYAGFENLMSPSPKRRLALVGLLGLIHGFGFASVLSELGLPQGNLLWALVAFNGGVELGQLMLVAITLPLLLLAARWKGWRQWVVPVLSVAIAMLGGYWTIERIFG